MVTRYFYMSTMMFSVFALQPLEFHLSLF